MKYDIFTRLLNHRVTDELSRSEDFLTEVFTYLLQNSEIFFRELINNNFKIKELRYDTTNITTQEHIARDAVPDIKLESSNKDIVCLIENKIKSPLGRNQLQKYLRNIKSSNKYYLLLINSRQNDFELPSLEPTHFRHYYWEDIYGAVINLINKNQLPQDSIELFLSVSFKNLLDDLALNGYVSETERLTPAKVNKICNVLDQSLSLDTRNTLQEFVPDNYKKISSWKEKSGQGSSPRPILSHNFCIEPKSDLWFCIYLTTYFQKPTLVKTEPHDASVICLHYKFFQTRIEKEAINHYKLILKHLGIKFNRSHQNLWMDKIRGIYKETARYISHLFEKLSRDNEIQEISTCKNPSVKSYWNSTTLALSYTKDIIDKYPHKSPLQSYYCNLLKTIVPLLAKNKIFSIRDRFYTRIFEGLSGKSR